MDDKVSSASQQSVDNKIPSKYGKLSIRELFKMFANSSVLDEELEVRFLTKGPIRISANDYENVFRYLKAKNYITKSGLQSTTASPLNESYTLKIQSSFIDTQTGKQRMSNIRTEISGLHNIQQFCNTNSITIGDTVKDNIVFLQKSGKRDEDNKMLPKVENQDFGFRVAYSVENKLSPTYNRVRQMVDNWETSGKTYRLVQRVSLFHNEYNPIRVDMSIVRSSSKHRKGFPIPTRTLQESNLLNNPYSYEIEIEIDKSKLETGILNTRFGLSTEQE